MKEKISKQIFSVLLAIVMTISFIPASPLTVLATGQPGNDVMDYNPSDYPLVEVSTFALLRKALMSEGDAFIVVQNDIEYESELLDNGNYSRIPSIFVYGNKILHLNGKSIYVSDKSQLINTDGNISYGGKDYLDRYNISLIFVDKGADLTVVDNDDNSGTLHFDSMFSDLSEAVMEVQRNVFAVTGGKLTVHGGSFIAGRSKTLYAVRLRTESDFSELPLSTVTGYTAGYAVGVFGGDVVITGGNFTGHGCTDNLQQFAALVYDTGSLYIEDGTFHTEGRSPALYVYMDDDSDLETVLDRADITVKNGAFYVHSDSYSARAASGGSFMLVGEPDGYIFGSSNYTIGQGNHRVWKMYEFDIERFMPDIDKLNVSSKKDFSGIRFKKFDGYKAFTPKDRVLDVLRSNNGADTADTIYAESALDVKLDYLGDAVWLCRNRFYGTQLMKDRINSYALSNYGLSARFIVVKSDSPLKIVSDSTSVIGMNQKFPVKVRIKTSSEKWEPGTYRVLCQIAEKSGKKSIVRDTNELTVTVKQNESIANVDIMVAAPVSGGTPATYFYQVYSVPTGCTVTNIKWYENDQLMSGSKFTAGKSYKVAVSLSTQNGSQFVLPLSSATVNGKKASVSAGPNGAERDIVLTYSFGNCPEAIHLIELNVTAPKEGNTPGYSIGCGSDAYYAASGNSNYVSWHESSDGVNYSLMSSGDKFTGGKYYRVYIDVMTHSGYEFAVKDAGTIQPDVLVLANGFQADVFKAYEQDPSKRITVRYDFGICNDSVIENIIIENVTAPIAGESIRYTYSVSGTGYQINTAKNARLDDYWNHPQKKPYYIKNGIGWFDLTKSDWVYENETFIPGHQYQVRVYLIAENDYEFAHSKWYEPTVTATVNGYTAEAFTTGSDCAWSQQIQYTFTCQPSDTSLVMITDLDTPVEGKVPDFDFTAVHSDYYMADPDYGTGGIYWYDSEGSALLPTDTFRRGEQYKVEIKLIPKKADAANMCRFISPVTAYINGKEVLERLDWDAVYASDSVVYVYYTFDAAAEKPFNSDVLIYGDITVYSDDDVPGYVQIFKKGEPEPVAETLFMGTDSAYALNVSSGDYIVKIMKSKHVTRSYEVTVESEPVKLDLEAYLYGDVNGDGEIGLSDVTMLAKVLAGWSLGENYHPENADCNGSGEIGLSDLTALAKFLAGWDIMLGPDPG